jgi:perosamine synthetase
MTDAPIPYGRQSISAEDIAAVTDVLGSAWLTQGPMIGKFEDALAGVTGANHVNAVSNGTAGLHLAALACDLGPGDIGITSSMSFVASANCIEYCGAEVRFADIDARTGLISTDSLEQLVGRLAAEGRAPKVIIPVDMAGQSADLATIRRLADGVGAKVISDAAHSIGGSYEVDGVRYASGSCAHSHMAELSFHPVKNITTGEGGAVTTNEVGLARRISEQRAHGIHKDAARLTVDENDPFVGPWYYEQDSLGFNYRITDFQCALGLSQLKRLESFMARRRAIAARYAEVLSQSPLCDLLEPLQIRPGNISAYHLYVVQLKQREGEQSESVAARRKALYLYLNEKGIFTQVHYIPIPWQPYYSNKYGHSRTDFPGTLNYYSRSLSLPMFPSLADEEFDRVVSALTGWATAQ